MTFGEYFRQLLSDKDANLTRIASDAGIRNKTEIYRLFENKHSYKKAKSLTEKILSVIETMPQERETLYTLMEDCKIKSGIRKAWDILDNLYKDTQICYDENLKSIKALLKNNVSAEIIIYLGSETDMNTVLFLDDFLSKKLCSDIKIIHAVNFNRAEDIIALELFSIIRLMPHEEYTCFEMSKSEPKGLAGFISSSGKYYMFVLTENNEYAASPISKEMYDFLNEKYCRCKKGTSIKDACGHLTDYAYSITNFTPVDENNFFSFEGVFCFGDIPFDIMYRLLKDANYFGLPPDSLYITNIVNAAKTRYVSGIKSASERMYILSVERMKNLFLTGKTIDHVDVFRSLTKEEIKTTVSCFLNNDRFKYRFFKPDYSNRCIETAIAEDFGIILWDATLGYGKKHFQTVISHPKAMSVFKSFTKHFWAEHTLSDEKSKEKLNKLIKEYL